MIAFIAIFDAVLAVRTTLQNSILTDLHLPEQYFGIIYAISQIVSGIASNKQQWFHNRYRNRTLTVFSLSFTFSMIAIGLCQVIGLNIGLTLEVIFIMIAVQYTIKGPYYTLAKRYLNSFSTSTMRTKIYTCSDFSYCIVRTVICFICSALLDVTSTSYVYVILGCVFTVIFIFLLDHMKHTVGLKPEEYPEKDIKFVEIH